MKSRWLLVFPGWFLNASAGGGRLVGFQARAAVYIPDLQHCYKHTPSTVFVRFKPGIFKAAQPQPERANIHPTKNRAHSALQLNFSTASYVA